MVPRRWVAALAVSLLALAAPVVAEGSEDSGICSPCGAAYRQVYHAAGSDPSEGPAGLALSLPGLMLQTAWSLEQSALDAAAAPAPQPVPSEAGPLMRLADPGLVEGAPAMAASTALFLVPGTDDAPLDLALSPLELYEATVAPVRAISVPLGALDGLGSLTVTGLLAPAADPPAPVADETPPVLLAGAPGTAGRAAEDAGLRAVAASDQALPPASLQAARGADAWAEGEGALLPEGSGIPSLLYLDVPGLYAFAMLWLLLLVPPMYHRLQRRTLLEHEVRGKLYQLVVARPGIHIEELARGAGCSRSTAVYHLRLLARHGHIVAMEGRKAVHYYPNDGRHEAGERERRALLASPRTRAVAQCVVAQPGITRAELASAAGVAVSTLSWHLGRLLAQGLVEERLSEARQRALYPAASLPPLLQPWEQVPLDASAEHAAFELPPADGPAHSPTTAA